MTDIVEDEDLKTERQRHRNDLIHIRNMAIQGRDWDKGHHCLSRKKCEAIANHIADMLRWRDRHGM